MADKVILAYSGGLDTSVAIRWLKETYGLDVVALTVESATSATSPPWPTARYRSARSRR